MPAAARDPSPVMGHATRVHDDVTGRLRAAEPFELAAREAMMGLEAPPPVGDSDFEDTLCEINRAGRRTHDGLLSGLWFPVRLPRHAAATKDRAESSP